MNRITLALLFILSFSLTAVTEARKPKPIKSSEEKVFQIQPGESANFEIVSYKLVPPQIRISPRFFIYKLIDGKTIGDVQRTWWVTNGNLWGGVPKSYKYPVWIRREENVKYKWNVQKLEGHNDYIVTNAFISAEDICKASDTANNNPFWITLSDGNMIQLKFVKQEDTAYQFIITSYKILNPKFTYNISFRVTDGEKEIFSKTQMESRTQVSNVSEFGSFELKNQEGNYVLEVSCTSVNDGTLSHLFVINGVIDRLNQEMKAKPDQKEWTIPVIKGDNQILLKYTRP